MNMLGKKMPWQLATPGSNRFNDSLNWMIGSTHDAEDAELIVRAVNSHAALVSASKGALQLIEAIIEGKEWGAIEEYADDLREALALAKGE